MPPLHTAMARLCPEVVENVLAPLQTQRLYHAVVPAETCAAAGRRRSCASARNIAELIRLIVETFVAAANFPPDEEERPSCCAGGGGL